MKFEAVSVDEALGTRKNFTNDKGVLFKAHTKAASFNDTEGSATFIMSAETEDRMGDVVVQAGIELDSFDKNPIAFFNHKSYETPIGNWSDLKTFGGQNKRTEGKMTFVETGIDDVADRVRGHVKAGTIKGASIGFIPKSAERIMDDDDNWTYGYRFPDIELLECSVVCVPAVREALMKSGSLDVDILAPEVIEEFLEHLKSNPALAAEINRSFYEDVLKAAYGNKTHVVFEEKSKAVNLDIDTTAIQGVLDEMKATVAEFKSIADASVISEADATLENPFIKEAETVLSAASDDLSKQLKDVPEGDEENRGLLQSMIDGLKGLFTPEPEKEPEIAGAEEKEALQKRLDEITSRNKAA